MTAMTGESDTYLVTFNLQCCVSPLAVWVRVSFILSAEPRN